MKEDVSSGKRRGHAPAGRDPRRPDEDRLRRELSAYMEQQGLRSTEQRRVIVDSFFEAGSHITLEELLERVRRIDSKISYATVYRTMKLLAEAGVAHQRKFGDGFTRYELADDDAHHDHLICVECNAIQEFEEPLIEELQERVANRYGFEVHEHKHELYGLCASCRAKRDEKRQ